MRLLQLLHEAFAAGYDGVFIEFRVGTVVMCSGLIHVDGFPDAASLINVTAVIQQDRRRHYRPGCAFEVDGVDLVKSQERHEQSNIGLRQLSLIHI